MLNTLTIYYRFYDLLNDIIEKKGKFKSLPPDIVSAVEDANKKFKKFYSFMDSSDILNPRLKALWLKDHLKTNYPLLSIKLLKR